MYQRSAIAMVTAVCALWFAPQSTAQLTWTPQTGRFVNMGNLPKETPELQVEYTRSLSVGGQYKQAMRESDKFMRYFSDSEYADDNQFVRGEIKLHQEEYLKSAEEFQMVISNYPDSPLYDDVIDMQYEVGDTLFDEGVRRKEKRAKGFKPWRGLGKFNPFRRKPFKRAIEVYTMVIDNRPFSDEAAEAQFKLGLCHFHREAYLEAGFEFRRVLEDYPRSEWVKEAAFNLTRTFEEASLSPEYDQAPSQLAIDSINDFARRYPNDPRIDERKEVSAEMRETIAQQRYRTARFYEKRHQHGSARIYYEVLAGEYAGTEAAEKAEAWLADHPPIDRAQSKFIGPAVLR